MRNRSTLILLAGLVLGLALGWQIRKVASDKSRQPETWTNAVDTVTGATRSMTDIVGAIPEDPYYEVLGKVQGLKGTVIRYDKNLYRGGDVLSEKGMQTLKEQGIQTILAVTPSPEQRLWAEALGIRYEEIEFDYRSVPMDFQVVAESLFRDAPHPFYVHCFSGTTRGGVLAMLYRMRIQGWSFERALIEFGRLGGDLAKSHNLTQSVRSENPPKQSVKADEGQPND